MPHARGLEGEYLPRTKTNTDRDIEINWKLHRSCLHQDIVKAVELTLRHEKALAEQGLSSVSSMVRTRGIEPPRP